MWIYLVPKDNTLYLRAAELGEVFTAVFFLTFRKPWAAASGRARQLLRVPVQWAGTD